MNLKQVHVIAVIAGHSLDQSKKRGIMSEKYKKDIRIKGPIVRASLTQIEKETRQLEKRLDALSDDIDDLHDSNLIKRYTRISAGFRHVLNSAIVLRMEIIDHEYRNK